jgi:hypothetical protein
MKISDASIIELKLRNPCDQVAARWVALRAKGKKWIGPCPLHSPDPHARDSTSFECDAEGWVCAVCHQGGDQIKLVALYHGLDPKADFLRAVELLGGVVELTPERAEELERERKIRTEARERESNEYRERERRTAFDIWHAGLDWRGTPVEDYLRRCRGLPVLPQRLQVRHAPMVAFFHGEEINEVGRKAPRVVHRGPAMLAPIVDGEGFFRAVHMTWLDPEQPNGKACIVDPDSTTGETLDPKKVRGSKAGNVIRLVEPDPHSQGSPGGGEASAGDMGTLYAGEGIETVLSVWAALELAGRDLSRAWFYSTIDLGNLAGKAAESVPHPTLKDKGGRRRRVPGPEPDLADPGFALPGMASDVVLLGDGDSDRFTTHCALYRASERLESGAGRRVRVAWAPDGADFNDELRGVAGGADRIVAAVDAAAPIDAPAENVLKSRAKSKRGKRKSAASDDAGAPGAGEEDNEPESGPRALGYDVDALNREYALVKVGSQAVIFQENPTALLIEHQMRMLGVEAFKIWFRNKPTEIRGRDGKIRAVTWATKWLDDRNRRQYQGIEFHPDPNNEPGSPLYLNLWSGFPVAPAPKPDWRKYKTFRDHLRENVCCGNERLFKWVFGFFAHIVQRPRERLGIALVLRGKMGTGKTKVGEIIGSLFPRHYFLVDDPRYVTGQFNAHMASCLLLQADEAVWAGDKAAEGRLKGLITAPMQQIEAKGIDPIRLNNYLRLIMTSNEEWVVPAGKDERRFAVLDVDPRCAKNHDYFAEMDAELAAGGLAHLLGDLLAFDLSSVYLREAPRTVALLEQKIRSLDSVNVWWFERLTSGNTLRFISKWDPIVPCDLFFNDYILASEKVGIGRKRDPISFGMALRNLIPGLDRVKATPEVRHPDGSTFGRTWCYRLPSLDVAREAFAQAVEQPIEWPVDRGEGAEGSREGADVVEEL